MAYTGGELEIIETKIFTSLVEKFLNFNEYLDLQLQLIKNPTKGAIIKGSGGIRKLRFAPNGIGKSGALRVIYYWFVNENLILNLYIYSKSDTADLTKKQIKTLKDIVERELL